MNDMTTRRFDGCARAILDAQTFVRANDPSLRSILKTAGGSYALELFDEVRRISDEERAPDPNQFGRLFRAMRAVLMEAAHLPAEQLPALRWHGAKLSELARRLPC